MLSVAKRKGAGVIIGLDMKPYASSLRGNSAPTHFDVSKGDAIGEIMKLSGGYGCDMYIEATGAGPAISQGLQMIRRLGTFVEISVQAGPVAVDWSIVGDVKELNINGSHLGPYCYPIAIQYLARVT